MDTERKKIKCVVWDLDNTIWNGTLLESKAVRLNNEAVDVIRELDKRGILNSISSKNNYDDAMKKLEEFGIAEYFLYPQINWNAKSSSIKEIAGLINIALDTFAFIDDQPFELDEVHFSCSDVLCISADKVMILLEMPEFNPAFVTEESKCRRKMYQNDLKRKEIEQNYDGPKEEFLASLNMVFTIQEAEMEDLKRVEELTVRTHQLNTTGYTYSYDELSELIKSPRYKLYVASLDDKFGTYGKIGIALVECKDIEKEWVIKLFLMSCRVMSRGVGTIFMNYIIDKANKADVQLFAEFVQNDKNRMMYITYKLGGFQEIDKKGGVGLLKNDFNRKIVYPPYVELHFIE
jgi:HAD-superfamily phosphatase, subfamily IIIC/FkbH-like domain